MNAKETIRIAAVGDIHCTRDSHGAFKSFFAQVNQSADVFVLCGDLTDYGLPEEARVLADEITASLKIPVLAVLGNHDYEARKEKEVRQILLDAGVHALDGESCEFFGVGFAGVKGFIGGFGRGMLSPWGEDLIKQLVHEALNESKKLEFALASLRTPQKIAILHYAPIAETVDGEPPEILPFLGCGHLEDILNRYSVHAAFHGHAHRGKPVGHTQSNVPVYNVALPLMKSLMPDGLPFRVLEVKTGA